MATMTDTIPDFPVCKRVTDCVCDEKRYTIHTCLEGDTRLVLALETVALYLGGDAIDRVQDIMGWNRRMARGYVLGVRRAADYTWRYL